MSEVGQLVDCFFRFKRLYGETGDVLYLVFMENVARRVGGEFYAWWRRVAPDFAGWWGTCDVEMNSCEDIVKMAVACWPNVKVRGCRSKELNYLFSGRYVC